MYGPETRVECESCETGISYCQERPCWPLPTEIDWMLTNEHEGLKGMWLDYWAKEIHLPDIEIVGPAIQGKELRNADFWPFGACTFLSEDSKCKLHGEHKPHEGAIACCKHDSHTQEITAHEWISQQWDTEYGRSVVFRWKQYVGWAEDAE